MAVNKSITFDFIKEYLDEKNSGEIAWIGDTFSPINSNQLILNLATNMRADPIHHNRYSKVFIYSRSIFEYFDSWKIILDESLRTLKDHGQLIIRSKDNSNGTLFELKSQLFRKNNTSVKLLKQVKLDDGFTLSIFDVIKENNHIYSEKSWSIGILSNGKKNDIVINLIRSICEANSNKLAIEFIIAGPEIISDEISSLDIYYVTTDINDDLPRISEKKNKIISTAKYANIAIFHDRYIVNKDYFEGFEKFGYDFDFLTIRQYYHDGSEFPAYLAFPTREKRWQTPIHIDTYDQILSGSFINGGLIVIKKYIAVQPIFNDLLLHNEAEDVELAFYLSDNGIIARFNGFSSAISIGTPLDYTSTFKVASKIKKNHQSLRFKLKTKLIRVLFLIWASLPHSVRVKLAGTNLYEKIKNTINS
ncbi:Uncharacterised protein [Yersinia frederiksenii]|nr:Uncharacterised protein [Yersinia frederiksenii]